MASESIKVSYNTITEQRIILEILKLRVLDKTIRDIVPVTTQDKKDRVVRFIPLHTPKSDWSMSFKLFLKGNDEVISKAIKQQAYNLENTEHKLLRRKIKKDLLNLYMFQNYIDLFKKIY